MHLLVLKWSRKLHKWLGIYVAILTLVWLMELMLLPMLYPVEKASGSPTSKGNQATSAPAPPLSPEEVFHGIRTGTFGDGGSNVELRYFPEKNKFVTLNRDSFVANEVDAETGALLRRHLDTEALFTRKSALAWANETLSSVVKAPFEISFVILAVTGMHLVLFPYLRRNSAPARGILGLAPDERFRFMGTDDSRDMARMAPLGLLPGVNATVLRIPRRGPVILSARHTRIAVARNLAATFRFEKVES